MPSSFHYLQQSVHSLALSLWECHGFPTPPDFWKGLHHPAVLHSSALPERSVLLLYSFSFSVFLLLVTINSSTELSSLPCWFAEKSRQGRQGTREVVESFLQLSCSSLLLLHREFSMLASSLCFITFSSQPCRNLAYIYQWSLFSCASFPWF